MFNLLIIAIVFNLFLLIKSQEIVCFMKGINFKNKFYLNVLFLIYMLCFFYFLNKCHIKYELYVFSAIVFVITLIQQLTNFLCSTKNGKELVFYFIYGGILIYLNNIIFWTVIK
ncbi:hypothetical protein C0585_05535 [Candidatus Woesearchaeota archaeon]|nr:MAG: hypothetical protein C0585_05535 [Candidatus Woesearchaeota archaeon]